MGEISSALIGIAVVLSAVFVPMAFFGGSTGVIYLVAMTLTPALCATLLKPHHPSGEERRGFFGWFNRTFDRGSHTYQRGVGAVLARPLRALLVYALVLAGVALMFHKLPTAFLPEEDQGMLMMQMTLPVGGTDEQLQAVTRQVQDYMLKQPEVATVLTVRGLGNGGNAQNAGRGFIKLKDWSERQGEAHSASAIAQRANMAFSSSRRQQSRGWARVPAAMVRAQGLEDTPQLNVNIDDRKAGALGVAASDINDTLSVAMGGSYVNDFLDTGRLKKVYMQGAADKRMQAEDIGDWYVRNSSSNMVPLSAFTSTHWSSASPLLERYNGFGSYELVGSPAPGVSSGDAMAACHGGRGGDHGETARRHRLRLDRPVLSGTPGRQPGTAALRHLDPVRVPLSGRAV